MTNGGPSRTEVLQRFLQNGLAPVLPRIFLSSSTADTKQLRMAIDAYLTARGCAVENFQTRAKAYLTIQDRIVQGIQGSRLFVLLLGTSYGSPSEPDPSVSWTHLEWRLAVQENKARLQFLHDKHMPGSGQEPPTCCEEKQRLFIDEIESRVPGTHFLKLIDDTDMMPSYVFGNIWDFITDQMEAEHAGQSAHGSSRTSVSTPEGGDGAHTVRLVKLRDLRAVIGGFDRQFVKRLVVPAIVLLAALLVAIGAMAGGRVSLEEGVAGVAIIVLVAVLVVGTSLLWGMKPHSVT